MVNDKMVNSKAVFDIFAQICQVPRPSKHEEQISRWLQDFAAAHGIECVADEAMNVIMRVPATPGYETTRASSCKHTWTWYARRTAM